MSFKTPHSAVRKRKIQTPFHPKASKRRVDKAARHEVSKDIMTRRWSCYSCSPLHNFSSEEYSLKNYSSALSCYLLANIGQESLSLDMSFPRGTVSIVRGLAIHSEEPQAMKIKVSVEGGKDVLELYLCSVDVTQRMPVIADERTAKRFCFLPLLLYSGHKAYFSKVSSWLETSFSCYVKPIKFNAIDLRWMVALWTKMQNNEQKKRSPSMTEFVWEVPVPDIGLKKIKYSLEQNTVSNIWKCLKHTSDNNDEVTLVDVDRFMAFVSRHLKKSTHIKFDALKLASVSVPFAQVDTGGKIKISSESHIHTVLAHLCCLATERVFPFLSEDG